MPSHLDQGGLGSFLNPGARLSPYHWNAGSVGHGNHEASGRCTTWNLEKGRVDGRIIAVADGIMT